MLLNFLHYDIESPFYYVKKRFLEISAVYVTAMNRIHSELTIQKSINPFIADFIKLFSDKAE